jgi:hypothetical protein
LLVENLGAAVVVAACVAVVTGHVVPLNDHWEPDRIFVVLDPGLDRKTIVTN